MSANKLTEAKRKYALEQIAKYAAQGKAGVIVLPEFMEEDGNYLPTESAAIEGKNGFGYVQLVQVRTDSRRGWDNDREMWAIQRGKFASLDIKYKPGQLLGGNIIAEDTLTAPNANNPQQDLKYLNAALQEAGIACTKDDQPIYSIKYWDATGTLTDVRIQHDNQAVIEAHMAKVKAESGGNSTGIRGVAAKKQRLEQLNAIPANKRNAAEKAERLQLMEELEA